MYSKTLGPMAAFHALKPGSTLASVPPLMRLNIKKPCRPKEEDGMDWKTTLPLYLGSARSIQEVGAAQPFSANIFLLYAKPVMPMVTPAAISSLKRAVGKISFSGPLGFNFSHKPIPAARIITPSSKKMTCICGLSLLACAFAKISEDVPGTTTTFTLLAFSKAGKTFAVQVFSIEPPFMPM